MGSGAVIYVPSFIKTSSTHTHTHARTHARTHTHTQSNVSHKPTLFFQYKEIRLKTINKMVFVTEKGHVFCEVGTECVNII
jgi:hypothetical protein